MLRYSLQANTLAASFRKSAARILSDIADASPLTARHFAEDTARFTKINTVFSMHCRWRTACI